VGDFSIDAAVCDRLVELHRACDRKGLVQSAIVENEYLDVRISLRQHCLDRLLQITWPIESRNDDADKRGHAAVEPKRISILKARSSRHSPKRLARASRRCRLRIP